jgi:hypothetical protein
MCRRQKETPATGRREKIVEHSCQSKEYHYLYFELHPDSPVGETNRAARHGGKMMRIETIKKV